MTLVEVVIALAILSIALTGTLALVRRTSSASSDPMLTHQSAAIAQAYLEEIMSRSFFDPDPNSPAVPCPTPEASRALYDNLCDYHGLDDSGARDQNGSRVDGLGSWRVRVTVDTNVALGAVAGPSDIARVDVRVTHGHGVDTLVSSYRTSY
jgi:MSHA pilin protein MshD